MSERGNVSPRTLPISVEDDAVTIEYLDGRRATYRGHPEPTADAIECQPGKHVHVLVTNETTTEGVIVYVNDRKTSDSILESTGVGRVLLEPNEQAELFPGVTVRLDGHAVTVDADPAVADGRVFVFEEDEMGERSYEAVVE